MTAVLLANVDYRRHMTNEGDQFQEGLRSVGWHLSGVGYDDVRDVPAILDRYRPARVVVHDKRDWDPCSKIAFRKDVGFRGVSALGQFGGFKAVVVKDAATFLAYHQVFYEEVGADAAIVYYHPESVERHAPWMRGLPLVRTYHSVDASTLPALERDRLRAVVSGARGKCYPLRELVFRAPERAGVDVLRHPGYGNTGTATPRYLETIGRYKVHVATATIGASRIVRASAADDWATRCA